jgi:tripartite ATP-independent transporter DctM subunit
MHATEGVGIELAARFAGLERRCVAIGQRVSFVGVIGILAVAGLMVLDVVLRAAFDAPISGLNEVVALFLAVAVAACLPAGIARRIGLDIDIMSRWLSPSALEWLKIVGHFVLLAFLIVLSWRLAVFTLGVERSDLTTMILGWPQAPFFWAVTALLVVCIPFQLVVACASVAAMCQTSRSTVTVIVVALSCLFVVGAAFALVPGKVVADLLPDSRAGLAIWFFCALWVAILLLTPLGPALGFAGLLGTAALLGLEPALSVLGSEVKKYLTYQSLSTLPLFLLMGSFASVAGLSSDIYVLANALFKHRRGGLALATIGGCAGFGALTGSSLATAVTIGKIALPEMRQRGYADSLATGCVAAGGTLGQIVPPSTAIIIFAILTEESIGKMFIAAIGPAIVAITLYLITVSVVIRLDPQAAPEPEEREWKVIGPALLRCWGVFLLFGLVMGGIYGGVFTETEAAAVGAFGAFLFALLRGKLNRGAIWVVMAETTGAIAMIYTLIFGAVMFSFFIGATQLPDMLGALVEQWDLAPILVVTVFVIIYLILGTVMESFAMMVITVPVFAPIISDLGYSLIWWGILTVVCIETGMITPPFGLNLFVLKSIAPNVPLTTVYRGVLPFCVADIVRVIILVAFPIISLWLPRLM